ncbi:chromosomal replication initiator protein DnaA [Clostridium sp. CAG:793]|jgi:chromosomal replication initiator protein|nr:chromosomal replication initiator protein DnaA [Clostridium sp. CAG:793]
MSAEMLKDLWNKAKDLLKEETTVITYETWIQPLELKSVNENIIVLVATNSFQRDTVESRYIDLLTNTFNFITNKKCKVIIKLDSDEPDILTQVSTIRQQ